MAHRCHWPNCPVEVPPKLWGCKAHWFKLPKYLRDAIWREYRPGQEITKTPSREYLKVAIVVQAWIRLQELKDDRTPEAQDLKRKLLNCDW